jgi:hypothetical protein
MSEVFRELSAKTLSAEIEKAINILKGIPHLDGDFLDRDFSPPCSIQ